MKKNKFLAIILCSLCLVSITTITASANNKSTYNAWYGGEAYYVDEYELAIRWDEISSLTESNAFSPWWNVFIDKTETGDYYYIETVWWDEELNEYVFEAYSITDGNEQKYFISGEMPPTIITHKLLMKYELKYQESIPIEQEIYIGGIKDTTKIIYGNVANFTKNISTNIFSQDIYGKEQITFLGYFIIISFGIIIIAKIFKLIAHSIRGKT